MKPLTREARQALALTLRKNGLSYRAIGQRLGIAHGTVRGDVRDALAEQQRQAGERRTVPPGA